jgi:hypothetical protein
LEGADWANANLGNIKLSNANLKAVDLVWLDSSDFSMGEPQLGVPCMSVEEAQVSEEIYHPNTTGLSVEKNIIPSTTPLQEKRLELLDYLQQEFFDLEEKKRELLNKSGFTPARQQSSDEGFSNNYITPNSLVQFRKDIQKQTAREIRSFLKLVQKHTEAQLCSLFLIDDDGYLKSHGFYGFDSSGNRLTNKFFYQERYTHNYHKSAVARAVKPDKASRYGKSLVLNKNEISKECFIDQASKRYIEKLCGQISSILLTPVNGPNRSYGVLRIIKTEYYSLFSSSSNFAHSHVWYLELAASQLAANLRDINSSQKLALISFMNRANIDIHAVRNPRRDQAFSKSSEVQEYLSSIIEHLVHSPESCVKAATLRLFSKEKNGLITVAASSRETGLTKDTSIRKLTDNPKPLVIRVYMDGLDCTITDLQKEIELKPNSTYNLQNKGWLRSCNFKSLVCLAIKGDEETIGTLVLYTGHKQVIANRDKTYFRVIADSLSLFISSAFSGSQDMSTSIDSFLNRFSKGDISHLHAFKNHQVSI